jgi:hypothetical protein
MRSNLLSQMSLPRPVGTIALSIAGLLIAVLLFGPPSERARAVTVTGKHAQPPQTTIASGVATISGQQLNMIERTAGRVFCPPDLNPYGGAVAANPPPRSDGVGVYPQTFERLGSLHGFHTTLVSFGPPGATPPGSPWQVTLQTVCGPKLKGMSPVQQNIFLNPGETKSVTATCPPGKFLIGGAFQRTDFTGDGGDFATTSWGLGNNAWMATGHAFGAFGGELNATAFCSPGPPNYEAESAAVTIPPHSIGTAISPACPGRKQLLFGGFGTDPPGSVLFANSILHPDRTYEVLGYNMFPSPVTITAEGYCSKFPKPTQKIRKKHRR